jgi:hypothetical protein
VVRSRTTSRWVVALSIAATTCGGASAQILPPGSQAPPKFEDTGAVGDKANAEAKIWLPLTCPPGQFIVGLHVSQASWVSQLQVICVTPSKAVTWSGEAVAGTTAGVSNGGAHTAPLLCPRDRWVSAISGKMAMSIGGGGTTAAPFLYLADPTIHCSAPHEVFEQRVGDSMFQSGQRRSMNNARYFDGPPEYCPPGMFAQSALVAIGGRNRIDVQAAKLRCARFFSDFGR